MRYYNNYLGRFITRDILLKNYIYGMNNPVIMADPFGLYGELIIPKLPSNEDDESGNCIICYIVLFLDAFRCSSEYLYEEVLCFNKYMEWIKYCKEEFHNWASMKIECLKEAKRQYDACLAQAQQEYNDCMAEAGANFLLCIADCSFN